MLFAVVFLTWIVMAPDSSRSDKPKSHLAASKYFRNKAGLFSWYSAVAILTDRDSTSATTHVIKILYKVGNEEIDNYYMGKVEIDSNYKITREVYDMSAASNKKLLDSEFGTFLSEMILIRTLKDYR